MKMITEMGNTLPKIIEMEIIDKPNVENSLSDPIVNPEFPNADEVWKSSRKNGNSGLNKIIKINRSRKVKKDNVDMIKAFCT